MQRQRLPRIRRAGEGRGRAKRVVLWVLFAVFVAGGIYSGLLFFRNLGTVVDVIAYRIFGATIGVPATTASGPNWERQDRVNILLLGLDQRPDEIGQPTRTDTMMLLTIDPYSQSAGMLSIPRDLYVPIPFNKQWTIQDRINTAHVYGDLYSYPGGGAALAMKTVEYNLGVRVHYYVTVDFDAFEKLIDTLGGIDIYLERPLIDNEYPTSDYGTMRIYIPAGQQHLDGKRALWYARSRHADDDFGRVKRQQQVLLAVRDKALQLDVIPRIPQLFEQFKAMVKTDMTLSEAMALARYARDVKSDQVVGEVIGGDCVIESVTEGGAAVLVPKRQAIAEVVQRVFFDTRLESESALVEVLNGSRQVNLAASAAAFLDARGFHNVQYGTVTDGQTYATSIIYDYNGKSYTVNRVAELLGLTDAKIERRRDSSVKVDVRVILGPDAKPPGAS